MLEDLKKYVPAKEVLIDKLGTLGRLADIAETNLTMLYSAIDQLPTFFNHRQVSGGAASQWAGLSWLYIHLFIRGTQSLDRGAIDMVQCHIMRHTVESSPNTLVPSVPRGVGRVSL